VIRFKVVGRRKWVCRPVQGRPRALPRPAQSQTERHGPRRVCRRSGLKRTDGI